MSGPGGNAGFLSDQQVDLIASRLAERLSAPVTSQYKVNTTPAAPASRMPASALAIASREVLGEGVFATIDDAVAAAGKAYERLDGMSLEGRQRMIASIREAMLENAEELARHAHQETGLGRVEHKIIKTQTLIVAAFSSIEIPREVARALASRAMRSTASGEFDAAWNDLLACHRLSRHLASANATLIEMLVAIAIDGVACQAEWKFVQQAPPLDVIQRMAKQRKTLKSLPVTADVLDEGERFIFLDAVMNLASGRGASDVFGDDAWVRRFLSLSIYWN